MMPEVCQKKRSCINLYKNKIVVLDTNGLLNIIQAIITIVSDMNLSEEKCFDEFMILLKDFLVKIRLCPYGERINVSKEVFNEEMKPTNNRSSLRRTSFFEIICRNNDANFHMVNELLKRNLTISPSAIPRSTIDELKRSLRNSRIPFNIPSDNDLGLLALTLELGTSIGGVLVTDDTNLQETMEKIQRNRYIMLSGRQIDTLRVTYASSLSYLNELYTCCKLLPPHFFAVYDVLFKFVHNTSRPLSTHTSRIYERLFAQIIRNISEIPKQAGET